MVGVEGEGLTLGGGTFGKAVMGRKLAAKKVIDFGIGGGVAQGVFAAGGLPSGLVFQMGQHGTIGPRPIVGWVDGQGFLQKFFRLVILFAVQQIFCLIQQSGYMAGVQFQGFF